MGLYMDNKAALERSLGHHFSEQQLLKTALTHRSAGAANNERLEFLGDSIVNHVVAEALFQRFPDSSEGEMSRMRASLVKGDTLAEIAREIAVGEHLVLGPGERKSGGHNRASILADTLEALAGAILLDAGYDKCSEVLLRLFSTRLDQLTAGQSEKDAKTRLQEHLQSVGSPLPIYDLVQVQGCEHDKVFSARCTLTQPRLTTEGTGKSRRKAEQAAAGEALQRLKIRGR
ncbi:MAG: ribonuclease III [Pseudomonadota bacterium]